MGKITQVKVYNFPREYGIHLISNYLLGKLNYVVKHLSTSFWVDLIS